MDQAKKIEKINLVRSCAQRFALRSTLYIEPIGKFDQEHIVGFHCK